mmetsp:Transcript_100448/g.216621  ORF Transcript_100448/g.216621 Transcript_100448/m.216621 type:complete len:102 (+) Transcript_100448:1030-1335(+)
MDDLYIKEVVMQSVDEEQPELTDRIDPIDRIKELFARRHFLNLSSASADEIYLNLNKDLNLAIGDTETLKGQEFLEFVKKSFSEDEEVQLLVQKIEKADYK